MSRTALDIDNTSEGFVAIILIADDVVGGGRTPFFVCHAFD